jgi:hypothetical protein
VKGGLVPDVLVDEPARFDPFAIPPQLGSALVARATRTVDSVAFEALRDRWASAPTTLEPRIAARVADHAPLRGVTGAQRSAWVGITTRVATMRVLEANGDSEALLRYRAREDGVIRSGLDVLAPGAQSATTQSLLPPQIPVQKNAPGVRPSH